MNKKDLEYFKNKLEKEKKLLESELSTIGRRDPDNPSDWQATPGKIQIDSADENEIADKMEELDENKAILDQLEPQLNEVRTALRKVENGTYGICEVSGHPIERERLEANPSARTCKKHLK